jgi:hypothetical protein
MGRGAETCGCTNRADRYPTPRAKTKDRAGRAAGGARALPQPDGIARTPRQTIDVQVVITPFGGGFLNLYPCARRMPIRSASGAASGTAALGLASDPDG